MKEIIMEFNYNYTIGPFNVQEQYFRYHNTVKNKKRKVENVAKVNCEYDRTEKKLGAKIDIKA